MISYLNNGGEIINNDIFKQMNEVRKTFVFILIVNAHVFLIFIITHYIVICLKDLFICYI